jgi:hypothetical protein
LEAQLLLLYGSIAEPDQPTLQNYHHSDEWSGAAWLTTGQQAAVVFAGTKGLGECWYGCQDGTVWPDEPPFPAECPERGWWSTDFAAQLLFFDPVDFAAVARGEMVAWQPQPYAVMDLTDYMFRVPGSQEKYQLGAIAFDGMDRILYVLELFADGDKPIVHVWKVIE